MPKCAGIFAAGAGSRLQKDFPGLIKPLVPVAGKPLVEWAVRLLMLAGYDEFTILFNTKGGPAKEHLKKTFPGVKFVFLLKDTASSWESFRLVSQTLSAKADRFLLSAVDSFFDPKSVRALEDAMAENGADAVLGVTDAVKDEKPLWADIHDGRITRMGQDCVQKKHITSGIYLLSGGLAAAMPPADAYSALRQYLCAAARDKKIFSVYAGSGADVDDAADIKPAEDFVESQLSKKGGVE
jgi:choline kinase